MWITKEVSIPDGLITSFNKGELVVFAGAGVSKSPPANFPNFDDLAQQVQQQCGGTDARRDKEPVDRYLGRLKMRGVQVNRIVHARLSDTSSQPTPLHNSLISLFPTHDTIRIVTTNFDRHFTSAAASIFNSGTSIYYAPALPLGRQFNGIVYLHGSVEQRPDDLVLTDEDFGRAYLTDGWATRFLQGMFGAYTVLFVGYSHNDPVMQYLARGLPPGTKRYVLSEEGNSGDWKLLDITPIYYPVRIEGERHQALVEAIKAWGTMRSQGYGDHEQRIRTLVQSPPPLEPHDIDYVLWCLSQIPTLRFFVEHADSPEWLKWVADKELLKPLFEPTGNATDIDDLFARWFAQKFVCQHANQALAIIERRGQKLHPILWKHVASHLHRCKPLPDAETLALWVNLLVCTAPQPAHYNQYLNYLLHECRYPDDGALVLILFNYLAAPLIRIKTSFAFVEEEAKEQRKVYAEVAVRGERYWLDEKWNQLLKPHLDLFLKELLPMLTTHIEQAHRLLQSTGSAGGLWDPVSYDRKAIEPHEQDRFRDDFDPVIDAARDIIDHLLLADVALARSTIALWLLSAAPLLKRLAIYAVGRSAFLTPDEKLEWLLENKLLYAYGLKHEIFQLLKLVYPDASEGARTRLLDVASKGPVCEDHEAAKPESLAYETYNLLCWLAQAGPKHTATTAKLEAFQAAYPRFKPSGFADFDSWTTSGNVAFESPISVDDLLKTSPSEASDILLLFQGDRYIGPSRQGLLYVVEAAVKTSIDWGWQLVEFLESKSEWATDLWTAIVGGWRESILDERQWTKVLHLLNRHQQLGSAGRQVGELLLRGVQKQDQKLPIHLVADAEKAAERLFDSLGTSPQRTEHEPDWLGAALNDPGGKVVGFWLHTLSDLRKEAKDSWLGLPENYRRYFGKVVEGSTNACQMGRVLLASNLLFLFALDENWTLKNIIPLFNWNLDRLRAQQAWDGYLRWGNWNKRLLPVLIPMLEQSFGELAAGLKSRRDRFCVYLASIAVHGYDNPVQEGWLFRFLPKAEEQDRKEFAHRVGETLAEMPSPAKTAVWDRWLGNYWAQRQTGIPVSLVATEAQAMIEWALELEPVLPQVVDRICAALPPDLQQTSFYYELAQNKFAENHPETVSKLLLHLLKSAREPFYHCDTALEITEQLLRGNAPKVEVHLICDELLRLGCSGASAVQAKLK